MVNRLVGLDRKINDVKNIVGELLAPRNNLVCSTKFGTQSLVFLHLIRGISDSIPIIWVDTGYNRRKTMQFVALAESSLNLNLHVFRPDNHVIRIPPKLNDPDHTSFTQEVKLEPFKQGLEKLNATHWLSSVRAYQTANRQQLPLSIKLNNQLTKVHPMLTWTEDQMDSYLKRYDLPLGPEPFDPTKGESFRECGLHEQYSWN